MLGPCPLVVSRTPLRRAAVGNDRRARALPDRVGQSCVIQMMVCEQQLLDVREDAAVLRQTLLESCKRRRVGRTRVDERERVPLQQPEIDRAKVGHGDRDLGDVAHESGLTRSSRGD